MKSKEIEERIKKCINFARHEELDSMIANGETTVKEVNKIAKLLQKQYKSLWRVSENWDESRIYYGSGISHKQKTGGSKMITLNKNHRFNQVWMLEKNSRNKIKNEVRKYLISLDCVNAQNINQYLSDAMYSKVVDLEETIEIEYI